MIDPKRIIDFLEQNECKITIKDYGKKRDPRPQIMLSAIGSNVPLNATATGPIIEAVVALMTANGIQTTCHRNQR